MTGTAAAAASLLTVMRTISEPARASSCTWRTVAATSAGAVLVIDGTRTGASPPIVTLPTLTACVRCRRISGTATIVSPEVGRRSQAGYAPGTAAAQATWRRGVASVGVAGPANR